MQKVNLAEKLALFSEQWKPKVVGELNGQQVKLVKLLGPFVWHHHDGEDELFLVVKGRFRMEFRDRPAGTGRHPQAAVRDRRHGQGRAHRDSGRPAGAHRRRVGEAGLQGQAGRGLNEDY